MSRAELRLGTRGSALARWQADFVRQRLVDLGHACQVQIVTTAGDRRRDVPLAAIGGKGLYTQDIETGLLSGELDAAVHSLKDVPSTLPPGLILGAILERADVRDALIAVPGTTLRSLPSGARLGTGSLRRQAQALSQRPDLEVLPLRGNVDTRLRRWRAGDFDALLLAAAGLDRLGLSLAIAERLDPEQFLPCAGQGALVVECREDDSATLDAVSALHHAGTAAAIAAERALLRRLDCGCEAPVAALGRIQHGELRLDALVGRSDGSQLLRRSAVGAADAAEELGVQVAETLLAAGAAALLTADREP